MSHARRHLPPLWVMALGLVAVAANLRTVMASVPPLVETIAADLGLSNAAMGALTTLPVLCMGVFAPTAQRLAARIGAAGAVEVAAACLAIGTGLRYFGDLVWPLYAGTFLAGVGIAVGGTLLPGLVKELFPPHRSGLVTGLYMFAMMGGATASSALAVPLEGWLGSWEGRSPRGPCSGWSGCSRGTRWPAVPGATGAATPSPGRRRPPPPLAARHGVAGCRVPLRPVVAVLLLPGLARADLRRLGLGPQARGVPVVGVLLRAAGVRPARARCSATACTTTGCSCSGPRCAASQGQLGLWLAPGAAPWLWAVVLGLGQGASFSLALVIIVDVSATPSASGRLAGMAFLFSYSFASIGPRPMGALRTRPEASPAVWMSLTAVMLVQLALVGCAHLAAG